MANKITYDDKVSLTTSALPRTNKCTDDDLNEIKQVVNNNADEIDENTININTILQQIINLSNEMKGNTLYENATGTLGNVTLNDNAENYDYIEIFYKTTTRSASIKVQDFSNKTLSLPITVVVSNTFVLLAKAVTIANNTITKEGEYQYTRSDNTFSETNTIYIYKVIGYKY